MTYQFPEDIADGIRLVSGVELWNEIALAKGATAVTKGALAKSLKKDLSLIVERKHRGSTDDCSVGAFAVKPRACGAPPCGFGA